MCNLTAMARYGGSFSLVRTFPAAEPSHNGDEQEAQRDHQNEKILERADELKAQLDAPPDRVAGPGAPHLDRARTSLIHWPWLDLMSAMARRVEEGVFNATHASPADGFRPPAIPRRRPGPDSGPDPGHGARRDGRQSRQVEAQGGLGRPPGATPAGRSVELFADADYEGEIVQHPGSRRLPDAPRRERRRLGQPVPAPLTSGPRTGWLRRRLALTLWPRLRRAARPARRWPPACLAAGISSRLTANHLSSASTWSR